MSVQVDGAEDFAAVLISSCGVPTLLLDKELIIRAASGSFCSLFDLRPDLIVERELPELGGGEWDLPQLISILRTVASGHARLDSYEMDLRPRGRETRRLTIRVARLVRDADQAVYLLLSILDQTELQAALQVNEDLTTENAKLRQQLQMRIANTLQIIASIVLLAAQHVRAEHLQGGPDDARQKARAVADLQRQLSVGASGQVDMHSYLTQLCDSLRACMIANSRHLALELRVDGTVTSPKEATSLGLMVTEMVINAIRHAAFNPNYAQIVVSFTTDRDGWRLMVKDNGHAAAASNFKPGLGTGIIEALAHQLGAVHSVVSDGTGTTALAVREATDPPADAPAHN